MKSKYLRFVWLVAGSVAVGAIAFAEEPDITEKSYMPYVNLEKQFEPVEGSGELRIKPAPERYKPRERSSTGGDFRIHCGPSHQNNDDPIVYPDQESAAHHHTFFGNTGTTYKSTPKTLKESGNSTCKGGIANRSAYWLPSLIDTRDGTPLKPRSALFYYKGGNVKPENGFVIIAGDQNATKDDQQSKKHVYWNCNAGKLGSRSIHTRTAYIPECSGDLTAVVHFPTCWDGENLDSPNHKSHVVYTRGHCPASHPKKLPSISGIVHYNVEGTEHLRLSSDNYEGGEGGYSLHMDYIFAWDDDVLDIWWQNCQIPDRDCHADLLGDGTWLH